MSWRARFDRYAAGRVTRLLWVKLARDIREHGWQFTAVIAVVVAGVALYGGSYDSYQDLKASYDSVHSTYAFADHTGLLIQGNTVSDNYANGIAVEGSSAAQIIQNVVSGTRAAQLSPHPAPEITVIVPERRHHTPSTTTMNSQV